MSYSDPSSSDSLSSWRCQTSDWSDPEDNRWTLSSWDTGLRRNAKLGSIWSPPEPYQSLPLGLARHHVEEERLQQHLTHHHRPAVFQTAGRVMCYSISHSRPPIHHVGGGVYHIRTTTDQEFPKKTTRVIGLGLILHLPAGMVAKVFPIQGRNFYLAFAPAVVTSNNRGEISMVVHNSGRARQFLPTDTVILGLTLSRVAGDQLHTRVGPVKGVECTMEWKDDTMGPQRKKIILEPRTKPLTRCPTPPQFRPLIIDEGKEETKEVVDVTPLCLANGEEGWKVVGRPWPKNRKSRKQEQPKRSPK